MQFHEAASPRPDGCVLVMVVGHQRLKEKIEDELRRDGIREDFKFVDVGDLYNSHGPLGAQWPAVAVIVDGVFLLGEIGDSLLASIVKVLTRATTSILFIFHATEETMKCESTRSCLNDCA